VTPVLTQGQIHIYKIDQGSLGINPLKFDDLCSKTNKKMKKQVVLEKNKRGLNPKN